MTGSLEHTSVYCYSSNTRTVVRNNTSWNEFINKDTRYQQVIDSLGYMDQSYHEMDFRGSNTTLFFK